MSLSFQGFYKYVARATFVRSATQSFTDRSYNYTTKRMACTSCEHPDRCSRSRSLYTYITSFPSLKRTHDSRATDFTHLETMNLVYAGAMIACELYFNGLLRVYEFKSSHRVHSAQGLITPQQKWPRGETGAI